MLTLALAGLGLLLAAPASALASTASQCTSVTSGSWSSPSTWSCTGVDQVPAAGDSATVRAGDTVSLTANTDVASVQVANGAALDLSGHELAPTASFALGAQGVSTPDAVLESTGGSNGTLYSSGGNSFAQATISSVDVVVVSTQVTQFGDAGVAETSTWSGSSFDDPTGTLTFDGRYAIDGLSPSVGGDMLIEGTTTVSGTLTVEAGGTMTFAPQAAATIGDPAMLSVGGLTLSGTETVAVSQAQHTFAQGELYNLLRAPAADLAGLGTSAGSGGSFGTSGGDLYYVEGTVPAPAVAFTGAPTGTVWSSSPAAAYTLGAGTQVTGCTLDGQALSTCGSPIELSGLAPGSHTLVLSAENALGQVATATAAFGLPGAPQLSLGQQEPTIGVVGNAITVPIAAANARTVSCTLNGVSLPCSFMGATFSSPEQSRSTLTVSVTGVDGATVTTSTSVVVAWLPPTLTLTLAGYPLLLGATLKFDSAVPADSIDCSRLNGASRAGNLWLQFPLPGGDGYTLSCDSAHNVVTIGASNFVQGRVMIPTRYGDFWVLLSSSLGDLSLLESTLGVAALPDWITNNSSVLTCPTAPGAQKYVWEFNGYVDLNEGRTISADLVPRNATVTCAAIGPFGVVGTVQVLVDRSHYIQAAASVISSSDHATTYVRSSAGRHARRRAHRLRLTIRASGRATIAVLAYNVARRGSGQRARLGRHLAYQRTLTVRRGLTRIRFGGRLNPGRAEIVIRAVLRRASRHQRVRYGKQITLV